MTAIERAEALLALAEREPCGHRSVVGTCCAARLAARCAVEGLDPYELLRSYIDAAKATEWIKTDIAYTAPEVLAAKAERWYARCEQSLAAFDRLFSEETPESAD